MERQHDLFCERFHNLHRICILSSGRGPLRVCVCVCVCMCVCGRVTERVRVRCLLSRCTRRTETTHFMSPLASLSSTVASYFFLFLSCVTQTNAGLLLPSSRHTNIKMANENTLFSTVAPCTDSQPLTTYTPSVMFYKHILNNSAHPHLPNGLFFPEGAWLLFASSRLSFRSRLSSFLCLLSPLLLC